MTGSADRHLSPGVQQYGLGPVVGARLLNRERLVRMFDRSCAVLARRLGRESERELDRWMCFPTRWDPYFSEHMTLLALYRYPSGHFDFHHRQLSVRG
jgi:hypothetical protein